MKANLGKTLRTIRKSKQMTLEDISDNHLSISQISRFERDESEISTARLINILDKLNISMEEFLIVHNQDATHVEEFSKLIQYISKEHLKRRFENIKKLLSESNEFKLKSREITMVKSIIYRFDNNYKPSAEEINDLTDYLFKVEKWGYYEITLLGNCVGTIKYATLFILTKEMLKNYIYSSLNKTNKKMVSQLAINCLLASIDNNQLQNCPYLISEIEQLLQNEFHFFEKSVFLFAVGYYEYKIGKDSGSKKMNDAIQVFELLGETNLALSYKEQFNKIVK